MKSLPFNSLDQAISLTSYALNNGLFFFFLSFNLLGLLVLSVSHLWCKALQWCLCGTE